MKVRLRFSDTKFNNTDEDFLKNFINFLQKKYPLKKDISIMFLGEQMGGMSTGSRNEKSELKVLAKGRLNRDIMRTLAHEWIHEYQMSVQKREHGPDIGGKNEDEANAFAGRLIKMFEKDNPNLEHKMYESKSIDNRLNLLTEQILLNEKQTIKENLISEMKKIGIEQLPYSYSSLQKFIDSKTMNVHYNKHYKGYVDKLNKALKGKNGDMELEEIIKTISKFDTSVRNNAGGAFNHALFWKMLSPKKQTPKGEIYDQIKKDFGNIKKMKDEFNQAAKDRFGSGWAWLYLNKDGKLNIMSLPNQDNPLMNVVKKGGFPLLGLDVWEHAYYLKYQNKRDEYINNFWDVVNWEFVNDLFVSKTKNKKTKVIKESKNLRDNIIEYSYKNIGFFQKMKTKKYYFNSVKFIGGDIENFNRVLLKGPEGEYEFDVNNVKFKEDTISINKEIMDKNYPNYIPLNKDASVITAGITSGNIRIALERAFPDNWRDKDSEFTPGLRGVYTIGDQIGDPKEDWSVMNFFDTKEEVKKMIYDKYKEDLDSGMNNTDILEWMSDLFKNNKEFVTKLVNRQWRSIKNGFALEKTATEDFLKKIGAKNVITYPFGSKMDRWIGVDVTIDGINYQIKPLTGYKNEESENVYIIFTYGMKDYKSKKKIDKIAFANKKEIFVFDNKNYDVTSKSKVVFYDKPTIY
jgi:Fe-Mn family superoxide dismutase